MSAPESIWNLLHDGCIAAIAGAVAGDIVLRVEIGYLTERLEPPCDGLDVTLVACDRFEFLSWQDDERTTDPATVAALDTEILSAKVDGDVVRVVCDGGELTLRYAEARMMRPDGTPISLEEIDRTARRYWDSFGADQR